MLNKGFSKFFGAVGNILRKEYHYCKPNIIRSNLYISMLDVSIVKSLKETILMLVAQMAILFINMNCFDEISLPKIKPINGQTFVKLSFLQFLDRNSFIPLVYSIRRDAFSIKLLLFGFEISKYFFEETWRHRFFLLKAFFLLIDLWL